MSPGNGISIRLRGVSSQKCCGTFRLDIVTELLCSQLKNLVTCKKSKFYGNVNLRFWHSGTAGGMVVCASQRALNLHQLNGWVFIFSVKMVRSPKTRMARDTHDRSEYSPVGSTVPKIVKTKFGFGWSRLKMVYAHIILRRIL